MVTQDTIADELNSPSTIAAQQHLLVRVERDPPSAAYFPQVIQRIGSFCYRYGGAPTVLLDDVWSRFASRSPFLGIWAAFLAGSDEIIGHGLVTVQLWDGAHVGWVHQVEMDIVARRDLVETFVRNIDEWAMMLNATQPGLKQFPIKRLMMVTYRGNEPKAWGRHAGFHEYGRLLSREVR